MSQPPAVETIVERLRAAVGMSPSVPGSDELLDVRNEIALAEEGSRQTGQLNPRHPGALNDAIQFSKKVMRRSLAWYTRPLHLFEGAVIRSLQHIGNILNDYRGRLHQHAEMLNQQADVIERNKAWLDEQLQVLRVATDQGIQQLREQVEATSAAQETRLVSIVDKQLLPLENSMTALEASFEQASRRVIEWEEDIDRLRTDGRQVGAHVDALKVHFNLLSAHVEDLAKQIRQTSVQLRVRERDLRRLRRATGPEPVPPMPNKLTPVPPMFPSEIKHELEFDYFAFEEQYRGAESDIRTRQQTYVDYFRSRDNVVDLGCGRGEFLEALRDAGISARGVELGTDQILLCQEKGLDVVQQDLFAFLESTADDSLGGIFSAQVIEHMTASDQLRYVALAYQKCKPGSPVIFETINPQCVFALVRNFFLDPTHIRPVHPETLQFAMESCDFRNVTLRFSAPLTESQIPKLTLEGKTPGLEQFNEGIARVNELLYGFQDYAAIGWR